MKIEKPRFELTRVYSDGTKEIPEIIPVTEMPWDTKMKRRGFLGVGVGIAALLFLLDDKAEAKGFERWQKIESSGLDDISTKAPSETLSAHLYAVDALTVSPDGKTIVSVGGDGFLKTWSLPNGRLILRRKILTDEDAGDALAVAPNNKTLFVSHSPSRLRAFSFPGLAPLGVFRGLETDESVTTIAVTPNNLLLAGGTDTNQIKLWSLPTRRFIGTLKGHTGTVHRIAITPDGLTLISASADKTIKLWSLADNRLLATLNGHLGSVNALVISRDGRQLISGSEDRTIKLWSLPDGKLITSINDKDGSIGNLALNPDDRLFTSNNFGKFINHWSLPDGKKLKTFEAHSSNIIELAVTPDGNFLISGHNDGVISIWDLVQGGFRSFLFDRAANDPDTRGISYNVFDKITGKIITFTLPCGSPIPKGAVCTCNCVRGTYREPSYGGGGGGSYCTCNKICTCIPVPSDRYVKESFETTDPMLILQRLAELPIQKWNYKWDEPAIRHIGPMAQDFFKAFEVGEDDKHIHPIDAQGVAFAAIQALYRILKERETQTQNLEAQLQRQREENRELKTRIEALEQSVKS